MIIKLGLLAAPHLLHYSSERQISDGLDDSQLLKVVVAQQLVVSEDALGCPFPVPSSLELFL